MPCRCLIDGGRGCPQAAQHLQQQRQWARAVQVSLCKVRGNQAVEICVEGMHNKALDVVRASGALALRSNEEHAVVAEVAKGQLLYQHCHQRLFISVCAVLWS